MKKFRKKLTAFICTLMLSIGFIGMTVQPSEAASYVTNGQVKLHFNIPLWLNTGTVKVKIAGLTYSKKITSSKDFNIYVKGSAAKSSTTKYGTIEYYNAWGTKDASTSFHVTGKDLKKKKTQKVSFKKTFGGFVKSISVKR